MELGTKIKQLREKAGLTQKQLADTLFLSPQSISKWENLSSMPEISLLPKIAEAFGATIDELFDLSVEDKLNRIERRLDLEPKLSDQSFDEYEGYLKEQLDNKEQHERALSLLAYLHGHRLMSSAEECARYAKQAIRENPGEKDSQWLLAKAKYHYVWDWNIHNHTGVIDFYKGVVEDNPNVPLPYLYLIDQLIADHRCKEAEAYIQRYEKLEGAKPIMASAYKARIALARFDEKEADAIIERMVKDHQDDSGALFEAAQYYADKAQYEKAIPYYEQSFEKSTRKPRYIDELMAISDIYQIMGEYKKAAETIDRILKCQREEWGMSEEVELKQYEIAKAELLKKAN
ncbi:MAG: helix-turn-helix domain-containing protein [Bacilli bacterium]|nr:helix-turn-helix domain-containing protein [Bacilli bacterium]